MTATLSTRTSLERRAARRWLWPESSRRSVALGRAAGGMDLRMGCWVIFWMFQPLPMGLIPLMMFPLSVFIAGRTESPACRRQLRRQLGYRRDFYGSLKEQQLARYAINRVGTTFYIEKRVGLGKNNPHSGRKI